MTQTPGRDAADLAPTRRSSTARGLYYEDGATLPEVPERPAWHAKALCAGMHDWYDMDPSDCRAICARCPARIPCARAGQREDFGVWGGNDRDGSRRDADRARQKRRRERLKAEANVAPKMQQRSAFFALLAERATVQPAMRHSSEAEHLVHNQGVDGSSPSAATIDREGRS